jgi:hypothetical protein
MRSANECRELADKCFQSAREAQTEDERMSYFGANLAGGSVASRQRDASSLTTGAPALGRPQAKFPFRPCFPISTEGWRAPLYLQLDLLLTQRRLPNLGHRNIQNTRISRPFDGAGAAA